MKSRFTLLIVITTMLVIAFAAARLHLSKRDRSTPPEQQGALTQKVPPLPPGVSELKFSEFFTTPVGPEGLVLTEKLRNLDGRRVRMLGYMVRQEHGVPGHFLFTPVPMQIHDHDSALADDLPPATVHVSVPTCRDQEVPFSPGLMLLTGTLSVGPYAEPDGRISIVRLALDPPTRSEVKNSSTTSKAAGLAKLVHSAAR